jgi:hypothetical protein
MEVLENNILSYQTFKNKPNKEIDINSPEYLYKFIDMTLKDGLKKIKKNNKKPFKLSRNRNLVIIQYPVTYDIKDYNKWYTLVETIINQIFYRKESDNDEIPDLYQRKRLFTTINSKDYEINGNVVIKSIPIYKPKKNTKTKLKVSKENKDAIKNKSNETNTTKKKIGLCILQKIVILNLSMKINKLIKKYPYYHDTILYI